jgi:phosphatidylserine/phosphatidylglycerophosphate/cardiolipin synthase-like enzyme
MLVLGMVIGFALGYTSSLLITLEQIYELENVITNLKEDLNNNNMTITELQSHINQKNQEIMTLSVDLGLSKRQITSLQNQVSHLQSEVNKLQEMRDIEILNISFSPEGDCEEQIIQWINRANESIHIMTYIFNLNSISNALIEAKISRNIEVKVVLEKEMINFFSEYQYLRNSSIEVRNDTNLEDMHNKVMVIDSLIVITGSFNWSTRAKENNNENLIVIKNAYAARVYEEEFLKIWNESVS